jgi:hypothetical protein
LAPRSFLDLDSRKVRGLLRSQGFTVVRIVSPSPSRTISLKGKQRPVRSDGRSSFFQQAVRLGDTLEVYAISMAEKEKA